MSDEPRRARDLRLLDLIDALPRTGCEGVVWRVVREGRDPLQAGRSRNRWCNGEFDVLYTSCERDGAIAEVHTLLSLQPVFPSKITFYVHRLTISVANALRLPDFPSLAKLGVDVARYHERDYAQTQDIADAAYFLGFDGLAAPSARSKCATVALFTDRIEPARLALEATEPEPIDWAQWRRSARAGREGHDRRHGQRAHAWG